MSEKDNLLLDLRGDESRQPNKSCLLMYSISSL